MLDQHFSIDPCNHRERERLSGTQSRKSLLATALFVLGASVPAIVFNPSVVLHGFAVVLPAIRRIRLYGMLPGVLVGRRISYYVGSPTTSPVVD